MMWVSAFWEVFWTVLPFALFGGACYVAGRQERRR